MMPIIRPLPHQKMTEQEFYDLGTAHLRLLTAINAATMALRAVAGETIFKYFKRCDIGPSADTINAKDYSKSA